jgi:hypothetical protein
VVSPDGAGAPDDARMLAWDHLRRLKTRIAAAKRPAQDEYTRVHLDESLMRIDRALNAVQTVGGGGGGGGGTIRILLGGEGNPKP